MRVAIHEDPRSWAPRWVAGCQSRGIEHGLVNCHHWSIIERLRAFDVLLWHISHARAVDLLAARNVIQAAEAMGLSVFPSTATSWHFDDKIAQKYALEAVGAPLVPTYVFYHLEEALGWLRQASFPLVAKLRRGAGSANVWLMRDFDEAARYCRRMFGVGIKPIRGYFQDARTKLAKIPDRRGLFDRLRRAPSSIRNTLRLRREIPLERGYAYFQEFLAGNDCDIRIAVVGSRAWGFTRGVRPGDFRASGSGRISYETDRVPREGVRMAHRVARQLGSQSAAFDLIGDGKGGYRIVEVSYTYLSEAVFNCGGYWDPDLVWQEGHCWPEEAILEDLLASSQSRDR